MSIVIWHDLLFQINKTSEVMQTSDVSLKIVEREIKATVELLRNITIVVTTVVWLVRLKLLRFCRLIAGLRKAGPEIKEERFNMK